MGDYRADIGRICRRWNCEADGRAGGTREFCETGHAAWFGYFVGICEIAGAIGVYLRKLSALAAAGLAIIMIGAVGYHVTYDPIGNAVPALVLLIFAAIVFTKRRANGFWVRSA